MKVTYIFSGSRPQYTAPRRTQMQVHNVPLELQQAMSVNSLSTN